MQHLIVHFHKYLNLSFTFQTSLPHKTSTLQHRRGVVRQGGLPSSLGRVRGHRETLSLLRRHCILFLRHEKLFSKKQRLHEGKRNNLPKNVFPDFLIDDILETNPLGRCEQLILKDVSLTLVKSMLSCPSRMHRGQSRRN